MTVTSPLDLEAVVVEQKRKFFEMRNQYKLFGPDGQQVGAVEQVKQSSLAFLLRLFSDLDVALPSTFSVLDDEGSEILRLDKPWFRMTTSVAQADGTVLGSIAKRIKLGKAKFSITGPMGEDLGTVRAENWRAKDFSIVGPQGNEVARVTKKWRGLVTEAFTDADTYTVELGLATEPMRSLALAAALAIDIVMKQKDAA